MPFTKDDLERVYYGQEADALDTAATVLGPHAAGYGVQVGMQPLHSTTKGALCTFHAHITNDKKPNLLKSLTNFYKRLYLKSPELMGIAEASGAAVSDFWRLCAWTPEVGKFTIAKTPTNLAVIPMAESNSEFVNSLDFAIMPKPGSPLVVNRCVSHSAHGHIHRKLKLSHLNLEVEHVFNCSL